MQVIENKLNRGSTDLETMALIPDLFCKDIVFGYIRQQLSDLFSTNQTILSVDAFHTIKFIVWVYASNPLGVLIADLDTKQVSQLVRIAETAERYDDMCMFVRKLVKIKCEKGEDLNIDERNLLSLAYKNAVGAKRASWRTLAGGFDDADEELLKTYKAIVENELEAICNDVLALLTDHLCKNVAGNGDETEVFYLKMCSDYYRYLGEFRDDENHKRRVEEFYNRAMGVAEANLNEVHPIRLRLAHNFSVCYYDTLKEPEKAFDLAKKSFDAALVKLDTVNDATYKDCTLIMKLMRDNLIQWTSSQDDSDYNQHLSESKIESENEFLQMTVDELVANLDTRKLVEIIRVAETAERYEDMYKFVKKLVKMKSAKGEDLDEDERNLLSVAFVNVVGTTKSSWRTLAGGLDDAEEELLRKYTTIVEDELEAICQEVLSLLKDHLCKNAKGNGTEMEVLYLKMCGDYYWHLSEFKTEPKDKAELIKGNAEKYYKQATDVAEANLHETDPTRLKLALNFSVCYFEILEEPEKACNLAKKSFDAAIEKLDELNEASYKDSTRIMQLLRDNLTLWTASQDDGDDQ